MPKRRKLRARKNAYMESMSRSHNDSEVHDLSSTPSVGVRAENIVPRSASPMREVRPEVDEVINDNAQQIRREPDRNSIPPNSVPLAVVNQAPPGPVCNRVNPSANQETPRGTGTEQPGREIVTQVTELLLPVISRLESLEAHLNDNVAQGMTGGLRAPSLGTAFAQPDRRLRFEPGGLGTYLADAAPLLAGNIRQDVHYGPQHPRPSIFFICFTIVKTECNGK